MVLLNENRVNEMKGEDILSNLLSFSEIKIPNNHFFTMNSK